jgi:hypothetical protein
VKYRTHIGVALTAIVLVAVTIVVTGQVRHHRRINRANAAVLYQGGAELKAITEIWYELSKTFENGERLQDVVLRHPEIGQLLCGRHEHHISNYYWNPNGAIGPTPDDAVLMSPVIDSTQNPALAPHAKFLGRTSVETPLRFVVYSDGSVRPLHVLSEDETRQALLDLEEYRGPCG